MDQVLYENLRALIGPELSWWCDYIGKVLNLLATVVPTYTATAKELKSIIALSASSVQGKHKETNKLDVRLRVSLNQAWSNGFGSADLGDMFDKVGKRLHLGWKVKAELVELVS